MSQSWSSLGGHGFYIPCYLINGKFHDLAVFHLIVERAGVNIPGRVGLDLKFLRMLERETHGFGCQRNLSISRTV